ncbi:MAG: acetate uptake transporter family protein [Solirubrobacteraceae bacterium]
MSAIDQQEAPGSSNGLPASIFLQPIAAPSVLGYYAGATGFLLFGIWIAGGVATTSTNAISLLPFLLLFAGIGQLAAAMWSYKARDAVAASIHGAWGGFWLAYGLLWLMDATHVLALPVFGHGFEPLGQWFIYMAVITFTTALAALARSPAQFVSQTVAGAAATIACAGLIAGSATWLHVSGWVFVAASALFIYHATALMLNATFGHVVLPHFNWRSEENRSSGGGATRGRPIPATSSCSTASWEASSSSSPASGRSRRVTTSPRRC